MSNLKIISKDNNYIVECVHCNGTGFCENYVHLYRTEIKKTNYYNVFEVIFNFSDFCKKCGKNIEVIDSSIKIQDDRYPNSNFANDLNKFFNVSKSDFENYLRANSELIIYSKIDSSEKPQKIICDLCSGKGYNTI
jgi:hypothetical protein